MNMFWGLSVKTKLGQIYYHTEDDLLLVLELINPEATWFLTHWKLKAGQICYRVASYDKRLFLVGEL